MKLKDGFITHVMDGEQIMLGVGAADFHGLVRSNETAAFIVDCLKEDTTEEGIVDRMLAVYDAPRDVIARDVFSDRPILLLDEATASPDADTEAQLLKNLRAMTDKTVVIVTHRTAAPAISDEVIPFEQNDD